eukprot:COSAG01_NODE_1636_length_9660_cov_10.575881_10_plen_221_part_00
MIHQDEHAEKRLVVVIGSQREVALGEVLVMKVATGVSIELKTPVAPSDAGKGVFVDPDLKSEAVFFPAAHIGFVIGRGGETIKRLQDSSGASIQIAKVPTGKEPPGTKQVDLSGTPQQLEHVKKLLDELRTKSQTMPVRGRPHFARACPTPGAGSCEQRDLRVRVEIMGAGKYENVGESQSSACDDRSHCLPPAWITAGWAGRGWAGGAGAWALRGAAVQ